jgi:hypothetical protein
LGTNALRDNTTGISNTAVGVGASVRNTVGTQNVAVGQDSLYFNNTGNRNTALGFQTLLYNTASDNTAVGFCAMRSNTTGRYNTALGWKSLNGNTSGDLNVSIAAQSLCKNTTGSNNIAIGDVALFNNTTGACNIAVGITAQCVLATGINNTIAVGHNSATSATTGHTVWGNSSNNVCNCVYAAWSNVSDCRDKTNIKSLDSKYGLALIKKLRPVAFNWDHRDTYVRECKYEYGQKDGNLVGTKEHYGLIAQELKSALDELDVRFDGLGHDDEKDAYRLTYEELIAPIIKSIQELVVENEEIKKRLETLENK